MFTLFKRAVTIQVRNFSKRPVALRSKKPRSTNEIVRFYQIFKFYLIDQ